MAPVKSPVLPSLFPKGKVKAAGKWKTAYKRNPRDKTFTILSLPPPHYHKALLSISASPYLTTESELLPGAERCFSLCLVSTCSSLESRGNPGGVQRLDSTSPVSPPRQKSHSSDASSWHHPSPMHFFDWTFFWWLHNKWSPFFSSENRPLLGMGGHSSHTPFAHNNRVPSSHPRIPGIFYETFVTGRLIISLEVELGILAHM